MFQLLIKETNSHAHYADLYPLIMNLRQQKKTYSAIARALNSANIKTIKGCNFTKQTIQSAMRAYGGNYNHEMHLQLIDGLYKLLGDMQQTEHAAVGIDVSTMADTSNIDIDISTQDIDNIEMEKNNV